MDSKAEWKPPDGNLVLDVDDSNEVVVGGVYLRLYANNPGWTLKRPKLFLGELLDTTITLMAKESGDVRIPVLYLQWHQIFNTVSLF
jgi:hypothetical protein